MIDSSAFRVIILALFGKSRRLASKRVFIFRSHTQVKNKTTSSRRKVARKTGKDLCCMFLLAILGADPAQTWQNTRGVYVCSNN